MKNHFKKILYIIPLFACLTFGFPCFASDTGFAWGQDVLIGSNGSANINSLLGDTYSFESLYSPGFVIGISNAYDELNNQLYDKFGWDLDDAQQKIYDFYTQGDEVGTVLNVLAGSTDVPALDILAGGYQVAQFIRAGGGKSLVLGLYDTANNVVDKIKGNILNQVTVDDVSAISDGIEGLTEDGDIFDVTDSSVLFTSHLSTLAYNVYTYASDVVFNIDLPDSYLFYCDSADSYGNREIHLVVPHNTSVSNITGTLFVVSGSNTVNLSIYLDRTADLYDRNNIRYDTYLIMCNNGVSTFSSVQTKSFNITRDNLIDYLTDNGFPSDETSVISYKNTLSKEAILQLLHSLEGHWVSTEDMSTVRDILDGGVITQDTNTGAIEYEFTDTLVDSLADIIDDILDKSQAIEGELEGVIDDSVTADPDDTDDDDKPIDFTGVLVPDTFPTGVFNPFFKVFDLPFDFFSFFEPLFYVFGSFSGLFALWTFIPFVFVILLFIWALK